MAHWAWQWLSSNQKRKMELLIGETMKYLKKLFVFIPVIFLLFLSCEQEVFVEPKNQITENDYGKLFVNSTPAGALIYINNKNMGSVTPDTIEWLPEGDTRVTLKKTYFWDTTFTVRLVKSQTKEMMIDYYSSPRMLGSITCVSKPAGAKIYLNNQNTEQITPYTIGGLIPGFYTVKFDYPEFRKDSVTLTVQSRLNSIVTVTLEDTLDVITYTPKNSAFPSYTINDIAEDKNGNIWAATGTGGLAKFDGKKFRNYRYGIDSFIPTDYVTQVEVDKSNNLWAGFSNGLVKYDGVNWEKITTKEINSIHIAADNTMLAATDKGGIIRYKNGGFDYITNTNSGLPSDNITAVCMDKDGKIWAALKDNGLAIYDGSSWIQQDSAGTDMPYRQCSSLALSKEGYVVGIFYQSLVIQGQVQSFVIHKYAKFDGTKWITLMSRQDYTSLRQMNIDSKNRIWFSMDGIVKGNIISGTYIWYFVQNVLRVFSSYLNPYTSLLHGKEAFADSKGNLWILGGSYGLVKVKQGRWED